MKNEIEKLIDSVEFMLSDLNSEIDYETKEIVKYQLNLTKDYLNELKGKME